MQYEQCRRVMRRLVDGASMRLPILAAITAALSPLTACAVDCTLDDAGRTASRAPHAPDAPLPGSRRYALVERFCAGPGAAAQAMPAPRAAQLALYERGAASVVLRDDAAPVATPPSIPTATAAPPLSPSRTQTQRIVGLAPTLSDAARRHDIDPLLLHAIAHVESRHNEQAISPAGARGVMQVMPATARRFGMVDPQRELLQAPLNVEVSAAYLKTLQRRFGNDLTLVLAAYNAGEGAVEKHRRTVPPYAETRAYVRQVLDAYEGLRRLVLGQAGPAAYPPGRTQ